MKIKLLAEDPIEGVNYPSLCNEDCQDCQDCRDYNDIEFPIDGDLIDTLVEMAHAELIAEFSKAEQDIKNNTLDK